MDNNLNVLKSLTKGLFLQECIDISKPTSQILKTSYTSKNNSLNAWIILYFKIHVMGAPIKTQQAKQRDLELFMRFFSNEIGGDYIDAWTPAVTKRFQASLEKTISITTSKLYSRTTINRIMATLKHFGRWVQQQRQLPAGDPFLGVKDIRIDEPRWNGLTPKQILSLKAACELRMSSCKKGNQNPLLEAAIFYVLLQTGLRESELVALNVGQYYEQGLHQVLRHKSKRVSTKVPVPKEAREFLDRYLEIRNKISSEEPLFLSRYGRRLAAQDVRRICLRLLKQTTVLEKEESFRFTPHMLRHTFLKKITDKHGVHFAQQISGNISIREIFRYSKPSQQEIDTAVEKLFQ